jgi:glycosyltransferase involved in cell wall biosynthesis
MTVLWLTNIPSPYRVNFFNELGKFCDLTVLFEKRVSSERDNSWENFNIEHFKAEFLPGKSIGVAEAFCPSILKYLNPKYDHIVVTTYSDPTGFFAITYMKGNGISYEIEGDGAFPSASMGVKDKIKSFLLSSANRYFSTANLHDEYYMQYGAKKEQIVRYPFTSLYKDDIFENPSHYDEKKKIRLKLGIKEEKVVISVGRFSYLNGYGKGYDAILRAAARLKDSDIGWYIVGGEPTEEFAKMTKDMQLTNVHYVDFKPKEELKEYYRASDLFVLMTIGDVWGLVINEAMACGLPVITTDKCVAGVELVTNGENGYIVPVGDDEALAERTTEILNTPDAVEYMGNASLRKIQGYTIENMAKTHIDKFSSIIDAS